MAQLLLHVGTRKTGTSFIQQWLVDNVDQLRSAGCQYPDFLPSRNHVDMALPFTDVVTDDHRSRGLDSAEAREAERARIGAQLASRVRPDDTWIVSSEFFSDRLTTQAEIGGLIDFLSARFDSIKVVMFLRRQEAMLPSTYSQSIRAGSSRRFTWRYCEKRLAALDLQQLVHRWQVAVGSENVVAMPYLERYKSDTGAILAAFGAATGLPLDGSWRETKMKRENNSLSAESIAFLRAVNRFIPSVTDDFRSNLELRRAVIGKLATLTDPSAFVPDPELMARISDHYRAANRELVGEFGDDQVWQEWLDQEFELTGEPSPFILPPRRVAELMVALAHPNGPVAWGEPNGQPRTIRLRAQKVLRRHPELARKLRSARSRSRVRL